VHTGPGTLAGRYWRRFWNPVYCASDLPAGKARPITILGEEFTLYRGASGKAQVVAARCAHRGTRLSVGWVEVDCIRCRYHGWRFEASGQCVEQPGEDPAFARKVRIRSYPTEEYLGLIFAYLGDEPAPPLPRYSTFEVPGVLEVRARFHLYNYFNSLENAVDPAHVEFAHRQSTFDLTGGVIGVPRVHVTESPWGVSVGGERPGGKTRVTQIGFPAINYIKGTPNEAGGSWSEAMFWRVPVDDLHHFTFNAAVVPVTGADAERYRARRSAQLRESNAATHEVATRILAGELTIEDVEDRTHIVSLQDEVTQRGQGEIADRTHERLGRSDAGVILIRQLWTRELRALAEGQALKEWRWSPELVPTAGGDGTSRREMAGSAQGRSRLASS
jgi:5,5'-dehydrodivanillate O-demethylase oxygenase subunit